ncbi:MAG TPA: mannose-6-phosphate isomerase, class I [Vicinamibacteria bacterium]|nr:mannose-6-phosphate isomerase, class I [Vicinamibacteria bacterium]
MIPLDNPIQNYAWGSRTAIAAFLGRPNESGRPEAELWIGAHPKAPSRLASGPGGALDRLIHADPMAMLGAPVAERYGELPFLLKVLAAAEPLSIQCHPNAEQARAGFARENAAGIPVSDARRNYRDPNHKPELVVAFTSFRALKGFRPAEEILAAFRGFACPVLEAPLQALERRRDAGAVRGLFASLMSLKDEARVALVEAGVSAARGRADAAAAWVGRLQERYPGDVGVLSPLFLNLVELRPEEAIFLGAGELHAHLEGTAVEIMANSDNVLRGGLTPKHVDVEELLAVATFEPGPPEVLRPEAVAPGERIYRTRAREFEMGLLDVSPGMAHASPPGRGVELLLGLEGETRLLSDGREHPLGRGRSYFVPASAADYRIEGAGRVCRARVRGEEP